jgi:glyoxylase-like metal-dependent hydrolase (beta-lactamase superfamily II)/rhodanese-related sulfurtransferase
MILKQFFDEVSFTYTYLLAHSSNSEAIILDPVMANVDEYLQFLGRYQLKLRKVIDTHTHADHISGIGKLRSITSCMTIVFEESKVSRASVRVGHGDLIKVAGVELKVLHTPGHTSDSCCFYLPGMVFTGDTLLIAGTGRTDFQGGDAGLSWDSITNHLFTLPEETIVYPGHDYKGENLSTIGTEIRMNPRLANKTRQEYIRIMNELELADPVMMDVAVPANIRQGDDIGEHLDPGRLLTVEEARIRVKDSNVLFVDLRDEDEIEKTGTVDGCLRIPYKALDDIFLDIEHPLMQHLAMGKEVVFFCAYGERSALALSRLSAQHAKNCYHIKDGMDAWIKYH